MTTGVPADALSPAAQIAKLAGYSGLEFVAGLADGGIRPPPMAETLPIDLLPHEDRLG